MSTPQAQRAVRVAFLVAQVRAGRAISDLGLTILGLTTLEIAAARQ